MSMYARVAGIWKQITAAYTRQSGVWKQANSVWVKRNGIWTQVSTSDHFEFFALGSGQTVYPAAKAGAWKNGVQIYAAQSTYDLLQFDPYGNMTFSASYDLSYDQLHSVTTNSDQMIADLNAMPNGQIFVLFSYIDSAAAHLDNANLPPAVYRVGGTAAIYGQAMSSGGAYMLMNQVGAQFQVYETYVGSTNNATNAAIDGSGYILNSQWQLG